MRTIQMSIKESKDINKKDTQYKKRQTKLLLLFMDAFITTVLKLLSLICNAIFL